MTYHLLSDFSVSVDNFPLLGIYSADGEPDERNTHATLWLKSPQNLSLYIFYFL